MLKLIECTTQSEPCYKIWTLVNNDAWILANQCNKRTTVTPGPEGVGGNIRKSVLSVLTRSLGAVCA